MSPVTATVIVPTYNRPRMIAACIAALQAQDADIDIVVVDDGSPTPLPDLPDAPHPLTVIRQDNAGPAAARNRGAHAARGDWLLFTDDDCRPHPHWAREMLRTARACGRPTLLGGRTINAVGNDIFAQTSQDMNDFISGATGAEPFFASNNIAVPRDAFLGLGGFDTGYSRAAGEDRALCRAWAGAGHAFASVETAGLDHHHAMSARRFWRQHRNYGYGAARFHSGGTAPFRPASRLSFMARLVLSPLRARVTPRAIARAGLIGMAQIATVQGFLDARREGRADRPDPDGERD